MPRILRKSLKKLKSVEKNWKIPRGFWLFSFDFFNFFKKSFGLFKGDARVPWCAVGEEGSEQGGDW